MFPISISDFDSRFRDSAVSRFRDFMISRFRDFTITRFRDFAIPQFRYSLISRFHDFAIPQVRDSANARFPFRDFAISRFRDFLNDRGGPGLRPYTVRPAEHGNSRIINTSYVCIRVYKPTVVNKHTCYTGALYVMRAKMRHSLERLYSHLGANNNHLDNSNAQLAVLFSSIILFSFAFSVVRYTYQLCLGTNIHTIVCQLGRN